MFNNEISIFINYGEIPVIYARGFFLVFSA